MPDIAKKPPIAIFADELARKALEPILERTKLTGFCHFEPLREKAVILRYNKQEILFSLPVRIGELVDQIVLFSKKAQKQSSATLDLGQGILNITLNTFVPAPRKGKEKTILLTEKETGILSYLYDNAPRKITREELLEAVWEYAKTAETHTLETHIYRLRRKIEPDPASPVILKKDEDGYYLG